MSWYEIREDGMPAWKGRPLEKNEDKLIRPFESPLASGHYCFSRGHLLDVAGHDATFENNFSWEEIWMAYAYWRQGYTVYAPNETIIWHNYDRSYRPQYGLDKEKDAKDKGAKHVDTYFKNGRRMREEIFGDEEYRRYMDSKWGVDLLGQKATKKAVDGGLDPYYFWDANSTFYSMDLTKSGY